MNENDLRPDDGEPVSGDPQTEPSAPGSEQAAPAVPQEPPIGFGEAFLGVFTAPKEAFRRIVARPWWFALAPLLVLVALTTTDSAVFVSRVDMKQFFRDEIRQGRFASQMSEAQIEQYAEQAAARPKWIQPTAGAVGFVVVAAILAALFWLVLLAFGGEITYGRSFQAVCWAFLPALLTALAFLVLLFVKDANAIDIHNPLTTNLASFFNKETLAKPVYVLLQAVDIFRIWIIVLLSFGLAAAARMKVSTAATAVVALYALWTLILVGFAFVF